MIDYNMKIIGCRGDIDQVTEVISSINEYAEKNHVEIQLFDACMVFGSQHLVSAFEHAKRSMQRGENATHNIGMEILLYASGERQIKKAIKKMGIKKDRSSYVALIIYPPEANNPINLLIDDFLICYQLEEDQEVILPDENMLAEYGINQKAILSVRKDQIFHLVLEKIALVDVIKK